MDSRINYNNIAPEAVQSLSTMDSYISKSDLEKSLLELVKLRVSQINGCAYCVDVHSTEARKLGESDRRLHSVSVWHESPFFTERERGALAWAEAVTLLAQHTISDDIFLEVLKFFNEKELVDLTMAIIAINSWNRLAVSFRKLPKSE